MRIASALLLLPALLAGCQVATPAATTSDAAQLQPRAQAATGTQPAPCTPAFNAKLASLIASPPKADVDNVGVCGTSVRYSTTQRGGEHGDHQLIAVRATMPSGQKYIVEVVTNDDLDGVVSAKPNDAVTAFGQAYILSHGQYAAGVHDVHCSTHNGALNGYVNVAGRQYPASCPLVGSLGHSEYRTRKHRRPHSFSDSAD